MRGLYLTDERSAYAEAISSLTAALDLLTTLPAMTPAEAMESRRIHRVTGLTGHRTALVTTRPFPVPSCFSLDTNPRLEY